MFWYITPSRRIHVENCLPFRCKRISDCFAFSAWDQVCLCHYSGCQLSSLVPLGISVISCFLPPQFVLFILSVKVSSSQICVEMASHSLKFLWVWISVLWGLGGFRTSLDCCRQSQAQDKWCLKWEITAILLFKTLGTVYLKATGMLNNWDERLVTRKKTQVCELSGLQDDLTSF